MPNHILPTGSVTEFVCVLNVLKHPPELLCTFDLLRYCYIWHMSQCN
jgi:hypothetical protein